MECAENNTDATPVRLRQTSRLRMEEPMKRVRYSVAMTLDGFIAGPNGESDWIIMDPDIDFNAIFDAFDTIVLGRKTYEATRQGREGVEMPGVQTYVFSRTLRPEDCPGVIVSADPKETLNALKAKEGKDIWLFGGGSLFRSLLELGLVDAVEVALMPVLLGDGIPLLPSPMLMTKLKLVSQQIYEKTGTVSLEYEVT